MTAQLQLAHGHLSGATGICAKCARQPGYHEPVVDTGAAIYHLVCFYMGPMLSLNIESMNATLTGRCCELCGAPFQNSAGIWIWKLVQSSHIYTACEDCVPGVPNHDIERRCYLEHA